jgi:hypothetical protein
MNASTAERPGVSGSKRCRRGEAEARATAGGRLAGFGDGVTDSKAAPSIPHEAHGCQAGWFDERDGRRRRLTAP